MQLPMRCTQLTYGEDQENQEETISRHTFYKSHFPLTTKVTSEAHTDKVCHEKGRKLQLNYYWEYYANDTRIEHMIDYFKV